MIRIPTNELKWVCKPSRDRYLEANKESISAQRKSYRESHRGAINERAKAYNDDTKQYRADYYKNYYMEHKEERKDILAQKQRDYERAKIEAGYVRRKDPVTGKRKWIYVGK